VWPLSGAETAVSGCNPYLCDLNFILVLSAPAPCRARLVACSRPTKPPSIRPLLEHVASAISGFDLVANDMRQRHLGNLAGEGGALGAPVPKRIFPPPPSCSTEKSWLHFRPPPVDFSVPDWR